MRGAAGTVSSAAIPEGDEPHLVDAAGERRIEQPQVAALIRIDPFRRGAKLVGHDPYRLCKLLLHRVIAIAPLIAVRRRDDGLLDELRLGKRQENLRAHAAPLAGLDEKELAAGGGL